MAVIPSSMVAPGTPQGAEGASRIKASTGVAVAASCATSPPKEWPMRIGGEA